MADASMKEQDLHPIEAEVKEMNSAIAKLAEKRLIKNNSGDDKLALFRQQAAIISRKKEGTAQKLSSISEEVSTLSTDLAKRRETSQGAHGTKVPNGEEFKKYVNELRSKSTIYKKKKSEISEMTAEYGILQRTEEILKGREKALLESLSTLEKKAGISGFHAAQEALEKVSERKSEMDESKGKTLEEISILIQNVMQKINDKKTLLSPIIQELRRLRQESQDMESEFQEKKRIYDATLVGVNSEVSRLEQEVKGYRQDLLNDQSREHYLNMMIGICEIGQDRALQEMKAYIGGDEVIEAQQKARGFKTYRDLYNKKIIEQENFGKNLRDQQKEIKLKYESNMKQLTLFSDVQKLLQMKQTHNKRLLNQGGKDTDPFDNSMVTQDRLVL